MIQRQKDLIESLIIQDLLAKANFWSTRVTTIILFMMSLTIKIFIFIFMGELL